MILDGETTITSILAVSDGYFLTGSRKENNYKLIVIKLRPSLEVEWEKTFGNEISDFEGQSSTLSDDGLLICGCSEGHASDTGGKDWKAYLLKLSRSGETIWERAFRIRGNECAYSVLLDENIILFGQTEDDASHCSFFISCLDSDGSTIWMKQYGDYPNIMAGGIIDCESGYIFSGSVNIDNIRHAIVCKIDADGIVEWEKTMPENLIFKMLKLKDGFLLAGKKIGNMFLTKMDNSGNLAWKSIYGKGRGLSLLAIEDNILLGGHDKEEKPILCHIDKQGILIEKITLERNGWIEAMAESKGKILLARLESEPKERTELMIFEFRHSRLQEIIN